MGGKICRGYLPVTKAFLAKNMDTGEVGSFPQTGFSKKFPFKRKNLKE